ncbi:MAG: hypothetical protein EOP22_12840 [Hyphomicrobiales bacterium]|nr:MAG: hypothetical protein EOP22_12840 [Hyphomicrobiales bacterium]
MANKKMVETAPVAKEKRSRISQSDIPSYGVAEARRVPKAIIENYAGGPTKPLDVAAAMNMSPSSGPFRTLTGAAIAFGLVEGGYNASQITVTNLGRRTIAPLEEGDDILAMREALLRPRVIGDFLTKYDGKQLPKGEIAQNVVESLGVPRDRTKDVFDMIVGEADRLGLVTDIKGNKYVNLASTSRPLHLPANEQAQEHMLSDDEEYAAVAPATAVTTEHAKQPAASTKRVFITHGKNKAFVDPIRKLLSFGELEAVVSVESQSVSQPVPEKVMAEMRSCSAAIIHVAAEQVLFDKEGVEHVLLNPNVLIEIGAAMALFGKRFILLVRDGVKLPSNLQGLFEVRYSSDQLDGDATIRLLEAINSLKATPIPQ